MFESGPICTGGLLPGVVIESVGAAVGHGCQVASVSGLVGGVGGVGDSRVARVGERGLGFLVEVCGCHGA